MPDTPLMNLRRLSFAPWAATCLVALASACSGPPPAPPEPPPLDPTGTFDIAMELDGQVIEGVMVIEGAAEEGYAGEIGAMGQMVAIRDLVVEGRNVSFEVNPEGFQVAFALVYDDDGGGFSGAMETEAGIGSVIGTRRAGGGN